MNRKHLSTFTSSLTPTRLLDTEVKIRPLWHRFMVLGLSLLFASCMLLALRLGLHSASAAQASSTTSSPLERAAFRFQPTPSAPQASSIASPPFVLAEYHVWHGCGLLDHLDPPPYTSTNPIVIANHIQMAKAQRIGGFVVNWYGPPGGFPNDKDRGCMDQATAELMRQAALNGFRVALIYDEGTISATRRLTTEYTSLAVNDLLYATKYFTMAAYLTMTTTTGITNAPAIFVFPYDNVDPHIDWAYVRNQLTTSLGIPVILLDEDPKPEDPTHDAKFDGFYAWVQPPSSGWKSDGTEWGKDYLIWFYETMKNHPDYSNKITVGGVWPGFDDSIASWGSNRYMWRRCGQTWHDTWALANTYNPPFVMIDTWNDFEEGTDIELGVGECLMPPQHKMTSPATQVFYKHVLVNTGKCPDTFTVTASSSNAWPVAINPVSLSLSGHISAPVTITLTIPITATHGIEDRLIITATSAISTSVYSSVTDITTIFATVYTNFLPILSNQKFALNPIPPPICSS